MTGEPLLSVSGLTKVFPGSRFAASRRPDLRAVDDVSLSVSIGETLGLVGESGCGKSTLGRMIVGLERPSAGAITLEGSNVSHLSRGGLKLYRRKVQMVFQDPYASFDPRMRCGDAVAEPLIVHGAVKRAEVGQKVADLLTTVGLDPIFAGRYPHMLSGGQRQRLGIARALALAPRLVVADEPTSALDVSIQAQIVNLLMQLQAELGVSYLFISHDIAMVAHVSHRIAVMYLGRIVETGTTAAVIGNPRHPYTESLIGSVPSTSPKRERHRLALPLGEAGTGREGVGCAFVARCSIATERCRSEVPPLRPITAGHEIACHNR